MKKNEFVSEIAKSVQSSLGNDYEVTITVVTKTNDVKHYGISVREKESAIAQVHYVPFFCNPEKENVAKIAQEIVKVVGTTSLPDELKSINVADLVTKKDSIIIKLVNGSRNVEYLKNAPHRNFVGDLEVSYAMLFSLEADGYSSTLITNDLLKAMYLTEEELYEIALQNTMKHFHASIKSMSNVIQAMIGSDEDKQEADMYVVTNDRKVNGANILLYPDILRNFCKKHHYKKVFIFPSSIHEVLLIRSEIVGDDINGLKQMIGEVNNSQVSADEILSYNVYQYEYDKDKVSMAEGRWHMVFQFKYETQFDDILNSNEFKQVDFNLPKDLIDRMRFMLKLVKEAFEQGACGAFYILSSNRGLDSEEYNNLLKQNYINEEDYEYDDVICQDNDYFWRVRVFLGTNAYWTFVYYTNSSEDCN